VTLVAVPRVQRHTLLVLVGTQIAGGVGVAAGIAVSSLVAAELSRSEIVGGAALTGMVIGAAVASLALSRLAARSGRRPALSLGYGLGVLGALGCVAAITVGSWPGLLAATLPFGGALAAGLAGRFAATDLADPRRIARALAIVVWAATVGAVAGPNLADPAQRWAQALGLIPATGPFLLCTVAFLIAGAGTLLGLRPDPLLLARQQDSERSGGVADAAAGGISAGRAGQARAGSRSSSWQVLRALPLAQVAVAGIVVCHLVMVGLMSLTPVHMSHGGATLQLVGVVISLHVAGMYALSPLFGWLADRVGRRTVLALAAALLVVASLVAGGAGGSDAARLTIGLVTLGLGWSAGLVAGSALLTEVVPIADRAGVQGLSDVAMNMAGALGGVLAGVTVAISSYAVLGVAAAAVAVVFLLVVAVRAMVAPAAAVAG
jgi:MFS family permease